ncbi:MAG: SusC/RagA family TonB-linked outer membrane protein [Mucilaginibacter sp.]|nr:SusC/RagA family TonB-linked outer membrane protein [Mucilaginibacter sp.]
MKKTFTFSGLMLLCLFFFINASFAQSVAVKGKATDAVTSESLPGVSIVIKGTTTGTQTDVNGAFSINAPSNATLVFTYIGYSPKEVAVNNQTTINVALQPESKELQQVVVIGYGTQRKRDVTGAVGSVSGDQLAKQPVQTPTQALQGQVAGVQVISSGQPNSQPELRIRGTGSVLGGVNPLYVVDGVLTDDIRNINSADIVTLDVLKDASAAIYGVRGANGVVIITTRKGKNGAPIVRYDATVGFNEISNQVKLADRAQYVAYENDANPGKITGSDQAPLTIPGTTNWYNAVLHKSLQTDHNISVSGGSDKADYFISANYLDNNGIIITNNYQRFTLRENTDVNISDKLKLSSQLSLTRGAEKPVPGGIYTDIYRAAPLIPAITPDGKYGNTSVWGNVSNPLLEIQKNDNFSLANRVQGNLALDYKPLKFITIHSAFNDDVIFDNISNYAFAFNNDAATFNTAGGNEHNIDSQLFQQQDNSYHFDWDNTITFDDRFGASHFNALAGFVEEKGKSSFINGSRIDVPPSPDERFLSLGNPTLNAVNNAGGDLFTRQSLVARVSYDYSGKYLLTGSFRRDGSSRFSQKFGNFSTIEGGWVISDEDFLKNNNTLNFLKLRASYGQLGNDNIGSSLYIVTADSNIPYYFTPTGGSPTLNEGILIQQIKDANLKWETTNQLDIGLEYAFFNSRLSGEIDYYSKRTKNALIPITIPAILGSSSPTLITNAATLSNKGLEFSVKWKDNINKDLSYNISANISYNKNLVVGLNGGQALQGGGVGSQGNITRTDNGQPVASYYVLKAIGVFQTQAEADAAPTNTFEPNKVGGLKYADINKDGKIDANDRQFEGSYQPKYFGGFNLGLNYKSFDLSANFYGNWGNKIYNGKKAFRADPSDNIEASYADSRFTSSHPSNTDPNVITQSTPASTYFLESGAYLRLNNLTVGYNLPKDLLQAAHISRLRVYVTSQNLFTAKKYSGFTPDLLNTDILSSGIELNGYPTVRTFTFGVNLQF